MTKILKNAVISSEVMYIANVNAVPPFNLNADLVPEPEQCSFLNIEEIEAIKNEAYQQGYDLGKEEGQAMVEQRMFHLRQQIEAALQAIPQAIEQNRLALNHEIADIVLHIVQQFFIENESNPQVVEQQINQLLKQLNNKQSIELYLHPKEIELLQNGEIQLHANHLTGFKIKANDNLALGGYVIKTEHGIFDGNIEKQIDRLKTLLLRLRHRGHHAPVD
ncbi:FliH/SctL family protein [Legionella fallonii]|uniref:Flagellar assembly protein FliH n=1 Tax=Legionella fallonii LLAP-10 TaxID=1212491 RepID=A0A098G647_9GAMM|nr:FliH/SctL family protein [Legionella fallonii]CEG57446.1 conserved protein of unknown function [Legionella fallonii LLAP-10]